MYTHTHTTHTHTRIYSYKHTHKHTHTHTGKALNSFYASEDLKYLLCAVASSPDDEALSRAAALYPRVLSDHRMCCLIVECVLLV